MQPERYVKILKSLRTSLGISRAGGLNLSAVAHWARLPRSTTYRYLLAMNEQGHVLIENGTYRNQPAHIYYISEAGKKLLSEME